MTLTIGDDQAVAASTDAVLSRIWTQTTDGSVADSVADLARWRADTDTRRWNQLEAIETESEAMLSPRPAELLAELGL